MKKQNILILTALSLSVLFLTVSCASKSKSSLFKQDIKIDYSALNCEAVGSFNEGVQWVTRRETTYNSDVQLYGLIDEKGKFLIEMTDEYTDVEPFYDSAAWVKVGNNQYRAVDKQGNYLTDIYTEAQSFSDDVAWVKNPDGYWLVIDKNDDELFTYEKYKGVYRFSQFSEGKCLVVLYTNDYNKKEVYVLDKDGNTISVENSQSWYDSDITLGSFVNGYARCANKWGEVNGNVFCNLLYVKDDGSVLLLKTGMGGGALARRFYSAPAFENIEISVAYDFDEDETATVIFQGKDELYYKVRIDANGDFLEEPKNGLSYAEMGVAFTNPNSDVLKDSGFTVSDVVKIFT